MKPLVSIIMGSTSDLPVMEKACKFLNDLKIPFEVNALSAHRTPAAVEEFAKEAANRGIKVIKGMLDGLDAMLSIIQMPPGIPVATVGVNASMNAAILAVEMLALTDEAIAQKIKDHKAGLGAKITKANADLAAIKDYEYKTN